MKNNKTAELQQTLVVTVRKHNAIHRRLARWMHLAFLSWAWLMTALGTFILTLAQKRKFFGTGKREFIVRLWNLTWLAFVWVLLWGRVTLGNIAAGYLVAIIILALLPLPRVPVEGLLHPIALAKLLGLLLIDLIKSSINVAWLAIKPGAPMGAVLRARVAIKSDMVFTLAIDYLNLVPGTMVVDFDANRRLLYVHLIDVRSPNAVQAFYQQISVVEQLFVQAFERNSEWQPSPYHGIDSRSEETK